MVAIYAIVITNQGQREQDQHFHLFKLYLYGSSKKQKEMSILKCALVCLKSSTVVFSL